MNQVIGSNDVVSNERIVELVQRELIARSKLVNTVYNVSQFANKGDKAIWFPKMPSFSVTKKQTGAPVQTQALVTTYDELKLDQHAVISWVVEEIAGLQTPIDLEGTLIQRAINAAAKQVDLDIFAELILSSASNPDHRIPYTGGTLGNETLAKADILESIALIEEQGVDVEDEQGNMFLAVNPRQKKQLLLIEDFVDASKFGSSMPVQRGILGMIYGILVVSTPNSTLDESVLYHREAVGFGMQKLPTLKNSWDHDHMGERYSMSRIYGQKHLNDGKLAVRISKP